MRSAELPHLPEVLGCTAQDCACGPGCIHEGFVDAGAPVDVDLDEVFAGFEATSEVRVEVAVRCSNCGRTLREFDAGPSVNYDAAPRVDPAPRVARYQLLEAAVRTLRTELAREMRQRGWSKGFCGRCRDPYDADELPPGSE